MDVDVQADSTTAVVVRWGLKIERSFAIVRRLVRTSWLRRSETSLEQLEERST